MEKGEKEGDDKQISLGLAHVLTTKRFDKSKHLCDPFKTIVMHCRRKVKQCMSEDSDLRKRAAKLALPRRKSLMAGKTMQVKLVLLREPRLLCRRKVKQCMSEGGLSGPG